MKIVLCIEYNGSHYSGWQKQNDVNSIQGEIEKALESIHMLRVEQMLVFMRSFKWFISKLKFIDRSPHG